MNTNLLSKLLCKEKQNQLPQNLPPPLTNMSVEGEFRHLNYSQVRLLPFLAFHTSIDFQLDILHAWFLNPILLLRKNSFGKEKKMAEQSRDINWTHRKLELPSVSLLCTQLNYFSSFFPSDSLLPSPTTFSANTLTLLHPC